MRTFIIAVTLCAGLVACTNSPEQCDYTNATPGSSEAALIDRVLLNTEYYFSNEPSKTRADIYINPEFAEFSRGTQFKCLDDSLARSVFHIRIQSIDETSATVRIDSKSPNDFNWYDIWYGTGEVWMLQNGDWKLYQSVVEVNENSEFFKTYFGLKSEN